MMMIFTWASYLLAGISIFPHFVSGERADPEVCRYLSKTLPHNSAEWELSQPWSKTLEALVNAHIESHHPGKSLPMFVDNFASKFFTDPAGGRNFSYLLKNPSAFPFEVMRGDHFKLLRELKAAVDSIVNQMIKFGVKRMYAYTSALPLTTIIETAFFHTPVEDHEIIEYHKDLLTQWYRFGSNIRGPLVQREFYDFLQDSGYDNPAFCHHTYSNHLCRSFFTTGCHQLEVKFDNLIYKRFGIRLPPKSIGESTNSDDQDPDHPIEVENGSYFNAVAGVVIFISVIVIACTGYLVYMKDEDEKQQAEAESQLPLSPLSNNIYPNQISANITQPIQSLTEPLYQNQKQQTYQYSNRHQQQQQSPQRQPQPQPQQRQQQQLLHYQQQSFRQQNS